MDLHSSTVISGGGGGKRSRYGQINGPAALVLAVVVQTFDGDDSGNNGSPGVDYILYGGKKQENILLHF